MSREVVTSYIALWTPLWVDGSGREINIPVIKCIFLPDNLSLCDHLSYNNPSKEFQVRMGPVPRDTVLQIRLLKEVAW